MGSLTHIILISVLYFVQNVTPAPTDDPALAAIEAAALKIDEASFHGDPQLIQKVDKVNALSIYRNIDPDPEKEGNAVFHRNSNDAGKAVVVLSGSEDFLRHTATKAVYVVLRQNAADPKNYFVLYAYVRNPSKTDEPSSLVKIGGADKHIEFDIWDHRGGSRNSNRAFGWTTCDNTVVTICKKHSQEKALDFVEYDVTDIEEEKGTAGGKKPKFIEAKTAFKSSEGDDANANYDFFWDLDNPDDESQAVGKIVSAMVYREAALSRGAVVAAVTVPLVIGKLAENAGMGRSILDMATKLVSTIDQKDLTAAAAGASKSIGLFKEVVKPAAGRRKRSVDEIEAENAEVKRSIDEFTTQLLRVKRAIDDNAAKASMAVATEEGNTAVVEKRGAILGGILGGVTGLVDGLTSTLGLGTVDDLLGGLLGVGTSVGSGLLGGLLGGDGLLQGLLGGVVSGGTGLLGGLLGGLMGGRSVEGVNAASKDMDTDIFEKYGWYTQDTATADLDHIYDLMDKVVFMGFGSCEWTDPQPAEFLASTSVETTLNFILRVLRTQCGEELKAGVKDIVDSKCMELNADKSIQITKDCPLRTKTKLTKKETSIISRIFNFQQITHRYVEFAGGIKAIPKTPTGVDVGSKTYGYVTVIISGLNIARDQYPAHFVLLARNLAFMSKFAFVKLLQDLHRYKACPSCAKGVTLAQDGLVYLEGIIQFIFAGLGPVQKGEGAEVAFDKFYVLNKDLINARVEAYLKI